MGSSPDNRHEWIGDYAKVRDLIEATYPDKFADFNKRMFTPGGFYRGNPARDRIWLTESGKADFTVPKTLSAADFPDAPGRYRLITMRSNDQFNTTIYGYSDRMRGIEGTRDVLLINPGEIERAGLKKGQVVALVSDAQDGIHREVGGLTVTPFSCPDWFEAGGHVRYVGKQGDEVSCPGGTPACDDGGYAPPKACPSFGPMRVGGDGEAGVHADGANKSGQQQEPGLMLVAYAGQK